MRTSLSNLTRLSLKESILLGALFLVVLPATGQQVPRLSHLTIREKVGQVFNIRFESLCDSCWGEKTLTPDHIDRYNQRPAGSFSLFAHNISDSVQLMALTHDLHSLAYYPLLMIDEEGGTVARIGRNKSFDVPRFPNGMQAIGATGCTDSAYWAGVQIGAYLRRYGLDVNYAPVADVSLHPETSFLRTRPFSGDPAVVAAMDEAFTRGLREKGVVGCYKHFPGHGNTEDTHQSAAVLPRTEKELMEFELIPYTKGARNGMQMLMVAHISTPLITGDSLPATLSPYLMTKLLRRKMHYKGLVITDALEMKAVSLYYGSGEAAVQSFLAGADILMLPADYNEAFDAMLEAVETGRISRHRLNQSVRRILRLKRQVQ